MAYLVLYLINGIITMFAENAEYRMLMYITKVMMMPLLALYFYRKSENFKSYKFIYGALFFSWWGDIFLMIPRDEHTPNAKVLFICGLISFLVGHLNYIAHFISEVKNIRRLTIIVEKPFLILPFFVYVFILLKVLYPTLGPMKIPVTVYGIVITSMLITAFNRKNLVTTDSFYLVFAGALLFVFSDSCIAINLFYKPFDLARVAIMSTYITAQALLIIGILKNKENAI